MKLTKTSGASIAMTAAALIVSGAALIATANAETFKGRCFGVNGCAGKAVDPLPDPAVDGTTVTRESYANCARDVETVLYTIHGGGHTWPGSPLVFPDQYGPMTRDISASELIGELFSRHSLAPHLVVRGGSDGM